MESAKKTKAPKAAKKSEAPKRTPKKKAPSTEPPVPKPKRVAKKPQKVDLRQGISTPGKSRFADYLWGLNVPNAPN